MAIYQPWHESSYLFSSIGQNVHIGALLKYNFGEGKSEVKFILKQHIEMYIFSRRFNPEWL